MLLVQQEHHLAQLKYIFPEAVHLEWVWGKAASGGTERQLLMQLRAPSPCQQSQSPSTAGGAAGGTTASGHTQLRESFIRLLFAHLLTHHTANMRTYSAADQLQADDSTGVSFKCLALAAPEQSCFLVAVTGRA